MWFEFITNTDCNWNCSYCAFDKVQDVQMKQETLSKHKYIFDTMNKIRQKKELIVVVEGGEIGLIEDNKMLSNLFYKIGQPVIINTNGLFFETDRRSLYPYIKKVFYHVAPDAKTLFKVKKLDVPMDVIYGIVDDNDEAVYDFITYNNHINFKYVDYESGKIDPEKETPEIFHQRLMCSTMNPFVSIDLAREVLCQCTARGCHQTIPLTEENFIKVLTGFSNFKDHNDMCDTCYRTCKSNGFGDIIENKKAMKKLL